MRHFKGKATRDTDDNKIQYARHMDPLVIRAYNQYMHEHRKTAEGLREPDNWKDGIPYQADMDSMMRHVMDLWMLHEHGYAAREDEEVDIHEALGGIIFNAFDYWYKILKHESETTT